MGIRTFITVLLGLAFQLAQVWPVGALAAPCTPAAKSCECCAGSQSCCCAKSEEPARKPTPQPLHPGGLLKGMAMKSAETQVAAELWHADGLPAGVAMAQARAAHAGFAGVRLAVAFCSFVI